jgi:hypothetical protein
MGYEMTEDEAWDDIEDNQQRAKLIAARMMAIEAAQRFCEMYKDEMSILTLRKAFEMGYMGAHNDGL